jgi:hypothetical protein
MGLLCLKRSLSGFCSDDDVRCRANDERGTATLPTPMTIAERAFGKDYT